MWDDEGAADLIQATDRDLFEAVELLPAPVEKADVFRILVCNEIGGVVRINCLRKHYETCSRGLEPSSP